MVNKVHVARSIGPPKIIIVDTGILNSLYDISACDFISQEYLLIEELVSANMDLKVINNNQRDMCILLIII
jgi:hypothetical protein